MLPFHAHAGKQTPALSYTVTHLEHSLMLLVSSLVDFSLTQWELLLCWLNTADRRKTEAKKSYHQLKYLISASRTKSIIYKRCPGSSLETEFAITTFSKPTSENSLP